MVTGLLRRVTGPLPGLLRNQTGQKSHLEVCFRCVVISHAIEISQSHQDEFTFMNGSIYSAYDLDV